MNGLPKADLIRGHTWIVEHFCAQYGRVRGTADLRAAGMHGLCAAASRYEERKGRAFSTYAWNWVKGYMLQEIRRSHVVPVPEHTARKALASGERLRDVVLFLPGAASVRDPDCGGNFFDRQGFAEREREEEQERTSDHSMRKRAVQAVLPELEPDLRKVVRRVLRGQSVAKIARELGLTQTAVGELLSRAESELRHLFAA